jgi:hypothetical protein
MSRTRLLAALCGMWLFVFGVAQGNAEPMFLSKQYTRCTTCHYSATGGGLLTPYGRSLSRRDLSTTGSSGPDESESTPEIPTGEEAFLFGALGTRLGPRLQLGIDIRPARLHVSVPGFSRDRNFFMNADLLGAFRANGWTVYGEIGREPVAPEAKIDSYEYWVGYQPENGIGFRAGRFLPAFGVHFADHTAYNRLYLNFDKYDQMLGVELSHTSEKHLLQVSFSPGRAESIIHDDGRQSFTTTGRLQMDLSPRSALVFSGRYRDASDFETRNGAAGVAFGFAPFGRLNTWTEVDTEIREGAERSYIVVNETALEAVRGLWLKFSPQIRTVSQPGFTGSVRMLFEVDFLPRTHFNANLSYYRDRGRTNHIVTHVVLAQFHMYL